MPEETGGILMAYPTRKDQSAFIHRARITRNYPYPASIMVSPAGASLKAQLKNGAGVSELWDAALECLAGLIHDSTR